MIPGRDKLFLGLRRFRSRSNCREAKNSGKVDQDPYTHAKSG